QYQITSPSLDVPIQIGLSHGSKNPKYQRFIQPIEKEHNIIRREAGSAYKFCMMLEGEIDIYPRFHPTSEWDTSSGQGLLESIGGGLLTLDGKPFEYNQRHTVLNKGFIAFRDQESKKIAFEALAQSGVID
ncbi:3'(2'),5'-bisphosphate nucleotidase CysQ family protein, partial [Acinetobacter oleivorans]